MLAESNIPLYLTENKNSEEFLAVPTNDIFEITDLNEVEERNFLGLFSLLLKIDKRVNSQLYTKK